MHSGSRARAAKPRRPSDHQSLPAVLSFGLRSQARDSTCSRLTKSSSRSERPARSPRSAAPRPIARASRSAPEFIAYAAFDAGLIDIEPQRRRLAAAALGRRHAGHDRGDRAAPRRTAARDPRHPLHRRADRAGQCRRHRYRRAAAARLRERRPAQARRPHVSRRARVRRSRTCTACSTTTRVSARRCRRSCSRTAAWARSPRCRCRWPSCCRIRTSFASPARRRSWAWIRSAELRAAGTDGAGERQAARQVRDAPGELAVVARPGAAVDDARALVLAEQVAEESRAARHPALGQRLHARAADSAECGRRVRVELDRVLRVRAADGARLSGLSAARRWRCGRRPTPRRGRTGRFSMRSAPAR